MRGEYVEGKTVFGHSKCRCQGSGWDLRTRRGLLLSNDGSVGRIVHGGFRGRETQRPDGRLSEWDSKVYILSERGVVCSYDRDGGVGEGDGGVDHGGGGVHGRCRVHRRVTGGHLTWDQRGCRDQSREEEREYGERKHGGRHAGLEDADRTQQTGRKGRQAIWNLK